MRLTIVNYSKNGTEVLKSSSLASKTKVMGVKVPMRTLLPLYYKREVSIKKTQT